MTNGKDVVRLLKKAMMNLLLFPFRLLPVKKNRVMLINSLSFKYAGNPKAVGDYLAKEYPNKFQIYLAVNHPEDYSALEEHGITPVKYLSLNYFRYSLTAKVFLSNSGGYSFLPMRKNQVVINTWHGGGAYKMGGLDVCDNTPAYIKDVKMMSKRTSLFLTTCTEQTKIFERAYLLPRERIVEIGMPRNDMLFVDDEGKKKQLKEKIGFAPEDKVVLYAPTFRKENDDQLGAMVAGNYDIDIDLVCGALQERFGGSWKFAYRLHPKISQRNLEQFKNAVNLSDYEDMQDLLFIADVLINDYSSSMWDFAFTNRPCFIFATDVDHYMQTTNWYTPIDQWPFPVAKSNNELKQHILNINIEQYQKNVAEHQAKLGCFENGTATKKLCEQIFEICSGK